jgi:hypothetical protein
MPASVWAARGAALVIAATFLTFFVRSVNSVPASGVVVSCCHGVKRANFLGCPYPRGDVWQTNIANVSPDPRSSAWIAATMSQGGRGGFAASMPTNELINEANNSTPWVTVNPKVKWHKPYSPIPWSPDFYIEPLSDHHSLVLQSKSCQYYEGYETTYFPGGQLSTYSNLHVDLTKPFVRPKTGGSTASGIPIGLLAVRPEELAAGVIHHAMGWDAVAGSISQTDCVSPAALTNCTDSIPYKGSAGDSPMPYGAHARLKRSFTIAGFSREAKIIATAMKTYGLFLYDTGCCDNVVVLVNDVYGSPAWTSDDARDLQTISPKDLEIVPAP